MAANGRLIALALAAMASPLPSTCLAQTRAAAPEELGFAPDRLQRLDAAMQTEIDSGRFAGIAIQISRHGKLIKDARYGFQDLASGAPLRSDAIFRIFSMTKPVVGTALMILFEEGKWQLDDPVAKFIPEFADLQVQTRDGLVPLDHPMTMRELLTSTAGFAAGFPLDSSNVAVDEAYAKARLTDGTLADMIAKLAKLPLETQPGAKFRYGVQHNIQAAVVERISGQSFDRFLAQRLFQPLGMVDTGFGVPAGERGRIVPVYTPDRQGKLVPSEAQGTVNPAESTGGRGAGEKPKFLSGAGGLYSTTTDYMRFAQMLANRGELNGKRILAPSTVRLMMSNLLPEGVRLSGARPLQYIGYGADLGIVLDSGRATYNSGGIGMGTVYWTGAHGTWFWIDPVNDIVVVGMAQLQGAGAAHAGYQHRGTDLRALSRSLIYQALVDEGR